MIGEMPIKITLRYYFSSIRLAKIQKFDICWQGYEKIFTHILLMIIKNGTTPWNKIWQHLTKLRMCLPFDAPMPLARIYPEIHF